ncbi:hypothetical protein SRB5_08880 [Streptomyces sp. RB5]|uniref:Uncharacterized protein n=1 Tax=Streptomyces smaragdinus TaxID=2585196 RepID=A0A7K0CBF8_9ACTN|nr:hypothetical protein [Streptomyces smaragdinus]MQY10775.1 hypothetical protein [Streptomyces smaragdinus]
MPEEVKEVWHPGSFKTPQESFDRHFAERHGASSGVTPEQYFKDAKEWAESLRQPRGKVGLNASRRDIEMEDGTYGMGIKYVDPATGMGGIIAPDGRVVTFWYSAEDAVWRGVRAAMLGFVDSYVLWRKTPFPMGGSSADLKMTYADLADADEYLTTVIRFVERGIFRPAPTDVPALLGDLMERIDRIALHASGDDAEVCRTQHAYAALMAVVYRGFLDAGAAAEEGPDAPD